MVSRFADCYCGVRAQSVLCLFLFRHKSKQCNLWEQFFQCYDRFLSLVGFPQPFGAEYEFLLLVDDSHSVTALFVKDFDSPLQTLKPWRLIAEDGCYRNSRNW